MTLPPPRHSRFALPQGERAWRAFAIQAVVLLLIAAFLAWVAANVVTNIARLNINTGFSFLARPAGFEISQKLIAYSDQASYFDVFLVALINTVVLTAIAIVFATLLGFAIGLARLSANPLVAGVAAAYVEVVRNVPLLLQLFYWYFAVLRPLPGPRQSLSVFGIAFLNKRGLFLPYPLFEPGFAALAWTIVAMLLVGLVLAWMNQRHRARTGTGLHSVRLIALLLFLPPLIVAWLTGFPLTWDVPVLSGFNFTGGMAVIPEFVAMALALSLYGASYIAEIVRSGISAVPAGQIDAARALGLRRGAINRFIVIPQALRVILPPLGTQYIVLLKNSSLAAAIAYPGPHAGVRRHRAQPDRPAARSHDRHHGDLCADRARHRRRHQPAQPPRPAGGALSMGKLSAFLRNCVATPFNAVLSAVTMLLAGWLLVDLLSWAVFDAVWSGNSPRACEGHDAACWVFIRLRFEQLLYGPYPASERWRVDIVAALTVIAVAPVLMPLRHAGARKLFGLVALFLLPLVAAPLLAGGIAGLKPVPTVDWGGIMLTLVIAAWTIATAIPLGLLLALGRRSKLPVIAYACAIFIELWRSLPLIGVLFLAVVMFPLFVPQGFESDKLVRALIAFTLFNAAIFAEVFRGGLQAVPHGQHEAARGLGLGYWRTTALVVLPQVLRIVMPGMINTCVSIIKETTVVLIIGLVEFLAVLQIAFADPEWLIGDQVRSTGYLFAALVFWSLCFALSRYSAHLDRRMRARAAH